MRSEQQPKTITTLRLGLAATRLLLDAVDSFALSLHERRRYAVDAAEQALICHDIMRLAAIADQLRDVEK